MGRISDFVGCGCEGCEGQRYVGINNGQVSGAARTASTWNNH